MNKKDELYWDLMNLADQRYSEIKKKKYREMWNKESDEPYSIQSDQVKALAWAFVEIMTQKPKKVKQ